MAVKFLKAGKCSLDEIRDIIPELDDNDITEIEHSGSGTQTIRQSTQKHLQNITINYRFYNCYNMIFMLLYLIGVIKFKYYRRMVFVFKKNVIGICVTSIHKPSVHRILAALSEEAGRRGYYIHIFATLSDLYHHTKNDFAQKRIFDLVTDMLLIPLNVMDENLGIITIDYNGKGICYECLYEFIITLDNMLGTIKSRMELISMHQQLNTLSEQTIQSLAEIVEAKSEFTGLHVKRVSEYTRVLAEAMGYTPDEVDTIRVASMMHDIGKINIPSSILEKPGKLTDDEFEVIKTHVTEGEKLLHNSPGRIMQTARIIALQHHEKWNGKGYLGIKGTDIALESRIVALADVFDALVSKRPYKTAFSDNTAYDIITKDSGSHFDPDVVDAFVDNYNKFISIHAQYTD